MPTAPQHGYDVIDASEVLASFFFFPTVKDKQKGYDLKLSFQLKPKVQIEVKSLIQPGERIARAKDAYTPVQYPEGFFFFFTKFCWLLASLCSPRSGAQGVCCHYKSDSLILQYDKNFFFSELFLAKILE